MRRIPILLLVLILIPAMSCTRARRASPIRAESPPAAVASPPPPPPLPPRVEDVPVDGDLVAFVVRGRTHRLKMLFVPGMCVHPGGYVEAFEHTAAARGDLVTLQGDVSCGGDGFARKWSSDLGAMNRRIEAAFEAAGAGEVKDVVIIGYSQGAERAERLVARWPEKYAASILMATPIEPSPADFASSAAVVTMAGTLDVQGISRGAVPRLRRAGVPAAFVSMPGARHGQMGLNPEESMSEALDFVEKNLAVKKSGPPASHGGAAER